MCKEDRFCAVYGCNKVDTTSVETDLSCSIRAHQFIAPLTSVRQICVVNHTVYSNNLVFPLGFWTNLRMTAVSGNPPFALNSSIVAIILYKSSYHNRQVYLCSFKDYYLEVSSGADRGCCEAVSEMNTCETSNAGRFAVWWSNLEGCVSWILASILVSCTAAASGRSPSDTGKAPETPYCFLQYNHWVLTESFKGQKSKLKLPRGLFKHYFIYILFFLLCANRYYHWHKCVGLSLKDFLTFSRLKSYLTIKRKHHILLQEQVKSICLYFGLQSGWPWMLLSIPVSLVVKVTFSCRKLNIFVFTIREPCYSFQSCPAMHLCIPEEDMCPPQNAWEQHAICAFMLLTCAVSVVYPVNIWCICLSL